MGRSRLRREWGWSGGRGEGNVGTASDRKRSPAVPTAALIQGPASKIELWLQEFEENEEIETTKMTSTCPNGSLENRSLENRSL